MVSITVVPVGSSFVNQQGQMIVNGAATTTYVFDAVLELGHEQRLEKTHHPIQTGADISSHAYLMPARLSLDVGMTDALAAYTPSGAVPWAGSSSSKSVNAYQTMLSLQSARQPLTVTTRLRTYNNMVITNVAPREDYKTITGLRMRIELEQIFTAVISTTPITARPDTSDATNLGTVSPSAVPDSTQSQFEYPQPVASHVDTSALPVMSRVDTSTPLWGVDTPGAGDYSSSPGQQTIP
jgi:hypothetical protein